MNHNNELRSFYYTNWPYSLFLPLSSHHIKWVFLSNFKANGLICGFEEGVYEQTWTISTNNNFIGILAQDKANKLKRDPSAELIKEIVDPTPIERLPHERFIRAVTHKATV